MLIGIRVDCRARVEVTHHDCGFTRLPRGYSDVVSTPTSRPLDAILHARIYEGNLSGSPLEPPEHVKPLPQRSGTQLAPVLVSPKILGEIWSCC